MEYMNKLKLIVPSSINSYLKPPFVDSRILEFRWRLWHQYNCDVCLLINGPLISLEWKMFNKISVIEILSDIDTSQLGWEYVMIGLAVSTWADS